MQVSKNIAEDIGSYYATNAVGRRFGMVMSGVLTQQGGLPPCF